MWRFELSDNDGNVFGELTKARERRFQLPLSRVPTGSFIVDASDEWANQLRQADLNFIKAYRGKVLMGQGPVITPQKVRSSSASSLAINWAHIGWRLGIRLIEESKSTKGIEYGKPPEGEWVDMGQVAVQIINGLNNAKLVTSGITAKNVTNAYYPGSGELWVPQSDTGIRVGTVLPCAKTNVGPWYFQNALQGISLIASPLNGFDWEIEAVEPYIDSIGTVFGLFNCQPNIGGLKEDCWFEYGTGKHNVAEITDLSDATGLLNKAYSTPEGFPENAKDPILQYYDWLAIQERGTIYEDIIPSDAVAEELRNRLLQNQINVRKNPKSVIGFKPTNDPNPGVMPQYGTDYEVGDLVGFRAVEFGETTFEGLVRVYEVDFEINDVGDEVASPILLKQET